MHAPPDLDLTQMKQALHTHYGLNVRHVEFFPGGEDAYGYQVTDTTDARYFLKVYRRDLAWSAVLEIPRWLKTQGLNAVAALQTKHGSLSIPIADYTAALYPFIAGKTAMERQPSAQDWRAVGRMIANLHRMTPPETLLCPRESFDSSWREDVHRILNALPDALHSANAFQRDLADLLLPLNARILQELAHFEAAAERARAENAPYVLCHHDPTIGNILFENPTGAIHLIDWDGILYAPKERDLGHHFAGNREQVQAGYAEVTGDATLNPVISAFYRVQWNIQEIVDYGTRLLFQDHSPEQYAHDLNEMRAFLQDSGILQ